MNKYNNNLWSVGYEFDRRICGSRQQLVQDYRSDFSQLGCHSGERVGKTTITFEPLIRLPKPVQNIAPAWASEKTLIIRRKHSCKSLNN